MSSPHDCYAAGTNTMHSVDQCVAHILKSLPPLARTETIPLSLGLDRVLAKPLYAQHPVPPHRNSAMDGYALASNDLPHFDAFTVCGQVRAGHPFEGTLSAGQCVQIMTGAPLPDECDTVVMVEQTECAQNMMRIEGTLSAGANVRLAGEDLAQGACALAQGERLTPAALGLAASLGVSELEVVAPLKIALCSTGDEINAPGTALPRGGIYDSNRFSLQGLLQRLGAEIIDLGIIPDTPEALEQAMLSGAQQADMIISSGGVSVGEADYTREVLAKIGSVDFWRLAIRPGRPMAFGHIHDRPFFGLPGNPVAVMVSFMIVVQPALRKLMGEQNWQPNYVSAIASETIKGRTGRLDFCRGIYQLNADGQLEVQSTGNQGSGILHSMVTGNCLIRLDNDQAHAVAGERVHILPFADRL